MKEYRWLLPFTHGVDRQAIEMVILQAKAHRATLVVVSLVACSDEKRSSGIRLEHIQQAKDFLTLAQCIAARHQVPMEGHEVFTPDVQTCIKLLVHDLHCDSIVIVMKKEQGVLLHTRELTLVVMEPPASLVLISLPGQQESRQIVRLKMRLLSWLWQPRNREENIKREQNSPVEGFSQAGSRGHYSG